MCSENQIKAMPAVILAAGMGVRLRNVVGEIPKGLLEIDGQSLIIRSIECLKSFGINQIIMVTGYEEEQYYKALKQYSPGITFITNEDYSITGSMHSLLLAEEHIQTDFLLLESDLLYEARTISTLLQQSRSTVLISGATKSGDEVYIYGESGEINKITKEKMDSLTLQGELVGVSRISLNLLKKMCSSYKNQIKFPSNSHYEDCISGLSKNNKINYLRIDDLIWTEIDDESHYNRALNLIYPKVQENNQKYRD
jgi:choline kinase